MKYNNLFDDVFKFKQQQNYLMNEFPFHGRTLSKNGKISDQVLMSSSLQSINSKYHHTSDDLIFCNLVMLELRQQGAFPTNACHSSSLGDKRAKEEGQIDSEWCQGGRGNHKPFSPHICSKMHRCPGSSLQSTRWFSKIYRSLLLVSIKATGKFC